MQTEKHPKMAISYMNDRDRLSHVLKQIVKEIVSFYHGQAVALCDSFKSETCGSHQTCGSGCSGKNARRWGCW